MIFSLKCNFKKSLSEMQRTFVHWFSLWNMFNPGNLPLVLVLGWEGQILNTPCHLTKFPVCYLYKENVMNCYHITKKTKSQSAGHFKHKTACFLFFYPFTNFRIYLLPSYENNFIVFNAVRRVLSLKYDWRS